MAILIFFGNIPVMSDWLVMILIAGWMMGAIWISVLDDRLSYPLLFFGVTVPMWSSMSWSDTKLNVNFESVGALR